VVARPSACHVTRLGGVALLLAGVLYLTAETLSAAAFSPTYDYAVNYISDLGVPECGVQYAGRLLCSPLAAVMNAGFIIDGTLFLAAGLLLAPLFSPRLRVLFVGAVVLHSAGNMLVGLFDETTGALAAGLPRTHVVGATLAILFGNGDRKFAPVQQVRAYGVAPTHVSPLIAEGVVLKEEVIFAVKEDEAVGVVGPMLARREVHLGTVGLVVIAGLGRGWVVRHKCTYQQSDKHNRSGEVRHWNRTEFRREV